jgi:membrane-associated phospholipid phosphatase
MDSLVQALLRALAGPGPILAVQGLFGDDPRWLRLFKAITYLGDAQVVILAILLALWFQGRRLAYAVATLAFTGALLDLVLWHGVNLPRPDDPRIAIREVTLVSSFPSGHTATATLVWGALAAFGRLPWPIAVALVCLVMFARLYLGMHYVRDLLGGLAFGLLLLILFRRVLWPRIERWGRRRTPRFYLACGILGGLGALASIPVAPNHRPEIPAFIAGMALGLPLEYLLARFTPARVSLTWQALKLIVGLGVLALLIFAARLFAGALVVRSGLTAVAALWGTFGAPFLFERLGLSQATRPLPAPAHDDSRIPARAVHP